MVGKFLTLRELLKKIEEDKKLRGQQIYIGSMTNFFWIGTLATIGELDQIENEMREAAVKNFDEKLRAIVSHKKRLADIKAEREILATEYMNAPNGLALAEVEGKNCELLNKEKDTLRFISRNAKEIPALIDYINNFTHLLDRKVEEVWSKCELIDEPGIGIKLEGTEIGEFWFTSEYKAKKVKKAKANKEGK